MGELEVVFFINSMFRDFVGVRNTKAMSGAIIKSFPLESGFR